MRHIYILIIILGSVSTTPAQTSKPAPVITRYYCFTGNIDKYPVTFHLYRVNDKFSGSYYYNSSEEAIDISGKLDKDRFLKLSSPDAEGNTTEVLSGNFKDSSFSGTWAHKDKLLAFRVSTKSNNSGLAFDYIYTHGEKKLPKEASGRTELNYEAAAVWPVAGSQHPATNLIKQLITAEFDKKSSGEEIGKVMIKQKNEILNQVKKEDEGITYELYKEVQIKYLSEKLLTLSGTTYVDGGGAHPNYYIFFQCVDLVHNRKLTITDVLDTLTYRTTLQTLLEKKFRTDRHLGKEDKLSDHLFSNIIPVGQNIALTSKGIGFLYNPYEVGSYTEGAVYLYIPYKELDSCLKPEFKELMGL